MNILFFLTPKDKTHFAVEDFTIRQTLEKLENSGYTSIPIVSKDGKYLKTITEGDLLRYIKNEHNLTLKDAEKKSILEVNIKKDVKPIYVYEDIEELIDLAMNQNFVPIIDDLNHFIGIVTRKSIISYFYTNNIKDKIK